MSGRYLLAPEAAADLVQIWRYIKKQSSVDMADRVEAVIPIPRSKIQDTTQFPRVALLGQRLYVGSSVVDLANGNVTPIQPGYSFDGVAAGSPNAYVSGQMFMQFGVGYAYSELIMPAWSRNCTA